MSSPGGYNSGSALTAKNLPDANTKPKDKKSPRSRSGSVLSRASSSGKVMRSGSVHARLFEKNYGQQQNLGPPQGEMHPLLPDERAPPVKMTQPTEGADLGPPHLLLQFKHIALGSWLNICLACVPLAFLSKYTGWPDYLTFMFSFFSLVPLAAMLGDFTEDLALRTNDSIGALLNATFGNATELIISIFALKDGLFDVIQNSLIGSVLGNMILVLGCAILAAGWKRPEVRFNAPAINIYTSLLLLASMGLVIPTVFHQMHGVHKFDANNREMSRAIAVCMIIGYGLFIFFQLKTHRAMFDDDGAADINGDDDEEEEEAEHCQYSLVVALVGLGIATVLIAFTSEFLVGAIEKTALDWHMSTNFIGVILIPIVGNAAEHATAVVMAWKGKMDIAIGVAVGSSIQIATLVVPLLVVISWWANKALTLAFDPFPTTIMLLGILIVNVVCFDGKVHWLEGASLLLAYLMVALAYLFYGSDIGPDTPSAPVIPWVPPPGAPVVPVPTTTTSW
eukprot:TRINITY_DN68159_c5_g1_i1.p1 TRINITY_DN68159_c5_g1~~TRINITY_DN68159_c5_g1_i1.p1  ORF type:complete len:508 (+),score=57.31 TRINITY_DN68159_c5_g1_i1:27-1550(+)